jgi:lipoprotein NlpD
MIAVLTAAMVGCASAPTSPRGAAQAGAAAVAVPTFYTVQKDDSLSKIANRYNLDYQSIARLNQIGNDYVIHVGQRLRLVAVGASTRPQAAPIAAATPLKAQPLGAAPLAATSAAGVASAATAYGTIAWRWPTNAAVAQRFDLAHQVKGLRFAGNVGDPVYAAADGTVIYASNGLAEYGNLILIQHSNGYITAYAHNQRLLVQEKAKVTAGQQVAEMGSSGTNRVMLEFQVRLNGKPMDPNLVLPQR